MEIGSDLCINWMRFLEHWIIEMLIPDSCIKSMAIQLFGLSDNNIVYVCCAVLDLALDLVRSESSRAESVGSLVDNSSSRYDDQSTERSMNRRWYWRLLSYMPSPVIPYSSPLVYAAISSMFFLLFPMLQNRRLLSRRMLADWWRHCSCLWASSYFRWPGSWVSLSAFLTRILDSPRFAKPADTQIRMNNSGYNMNGKNEKIKSTTTYGTNRRRIFHH